MNITAIIPSRSSSKRFKNKNITNFMGKPLFMHSINFAKKLKFIDKIIFTSDSKNYLNIAKKKNNVIIHKRSKNSSDDKSMEEDILKELRVFCKKKNIKLKKILWLRPTHPLRCIRTFNLAYKIFKKNNNTVMVTHKEDSRLFYKKKNILYPVLKIMKKRSMVRSQEVKPFYSIFSGEFFNLEKKITKKFLGKKINFIIAPKLTKIDIDTSVDLKIATNNIKNNKNIFKKFLHV